MRRPPASGGLRLELNPNLARAVIDLNRALVAAVPVVAARLAAELDRMLKSRR